MSTFSFLGSHGAGEGYLLPARPFTIPKNLLQDEESKQLVLQISKEVLQQQNTPLWSRDQNPGSGLVEQSNDVKWSEVIGHDNVKEALEELLVLPIQYPDLYERAGLEHGGTKGVLLTGQD